MRKAECDNPFDRAAGPRAMVNRLEDLVNAAFEQIVLIAKVRVERRFADVRSVKNLLHCDRGVWLFARESDERVMERGFRPAHSSVRCFRTILARCPVPNLS
jgi:hypothetical protein